MQKAGGIAFFILVVAMMNPGSAFARSANLRMLNCSGLGAANGYVTISLVGPKTVKISSLKYFITTADENVFVETIRVQPDGFVRIDFYSNKFRSRSHLVLSAPVGPAKFVTDSGTDLLNCQSNIEVNL